MRLLGSAGYLGIGSTWGMDDSDEIRRTGSAGMLGYAIEAFLLLTFFQCWPFFFDAAKYQACLDCDELLYPPGSVHCSISWMERPASLLWAVVFA